MSRNNRMVKTLVGISGRREESSDRIKRKLKKSLVLNLALRVCLQEPWKLKILLGHRVKIPSNKELLLRKFQG